ncbi:MAG: DNA cytosine methyltransferase [Bacteroidetes bacterium]|nr:DNA cytosine methyltransferase [Bacteroidota bacterium]
MEYWQEINTKLKPWVDPNLNKTVVDLFAGCGGLSLGFEANGFKTIGFEMDENASKTYNQNLIGECITGKLTVESTYPKANVVIGGPPCQPFSVGGKQLGLKDSRDGFPIFLSAVRQLNPEVFMFENVRGMLYKNLWYLNEVISELKNLGYNINYSLLNAVNYEVPQNRERVIVLGSKKNIGLPQKSHRKVTAGQALGELPNRFDSNSKFLTESMDRYVANYERASSCVNPRDLYLDKPARTLTCRNLAGSTGDMHRVKLKDGRRRRLTVREAARLQSFPDWFDFVGTETHQFNQIGNAVAPYFAYHLAKNIKNHLLGEHSNDFYVTENEQLKLIENEAIYQPRFIQNL